MLSSLKLNNQAATILATADKISDFLATKELLQGLQALKQFDLAAQVAAHTVDQYQGDDQRWLRQRWALFTYKNEEMPPQDRLPRALTILLGDDPAQTLADPDLDPETLSLTGAIYKRFWDAFGQRRNLELSAYFYQRAMERGEALNQVSAWTYAAINAAYLLDLTVVALADEGIPDAISHAADLRLKAVAWREKVVASQEALLEVSAGQWWAFATLAEALFGLARYSEAHDMLADGLQQGPVDDWELESTARQLGALAKAHGSAAIVDGDEGKALAAMAPLVAQDVARALTLGRVGLALSGGGYRASLYHIGVLARLAEQDLLRWIDTISCVSGGSVTGALYYLLLRQRLQTQVTLSRQDYINIVDKAAQILTEATQRDVRTASVLMGTFSPFKSIPDKLAQAFEKHIFRPAMGDDAPSGPIVLRSLKVTPLDDPADGHFNPRLHNWRRRDRVPMLVLNATTLNSGHNWQFTVSWMGEPPRSIDPAVDATGRLRRFYFSDQTVPKPHADTPLATAVMASACVPGIFRPVRLKGLYPGQTVRLIDGGVHDNQGIFGLDETGCSVMIVSDGSGQIEMTGKPCPASFPVLMRANSITMQAERRSLYQIYKGQRDSNRLKDLIYIHMKKGIEDADITWINGVETRTKEPAEPAVGCRLDPNVQKVLADTRTDLGLFPLIQAQSLMYAGYFLGGQALKDAALLRRFGGAAAAEDYPWAFLAVARQAENGDKDYLRTLSILGSLWKVDVYARWMRLRDWIKR